MNDSAKVEPLTRTTVYTHGVIGIPLAVIGYPLAIWIPAHYAGELGTGISLGIVGLLGFDPSGGVAASTEMGVLSLRLVYCCGPIFFYALAMRLIWSYPLTPARHARLRERIARKVERQKAAARPS